MTWKRVGKIMLQGLVAILPALLTLYILYWLLRSAETVLGGVIEVILPVGWYVPGMGILAGLVGIFFCGVSLNVFLGQRLLDLGEALLNRIPLVKTLYGSVKDFIGFFTSKHQGKFDQVVTVDLAFGDVPLRLLGFVTRSDFSGLPEGIGSEGDIAVYLPLSYQIGGYTVILPRSVVKPIDISTHRAMGFILTGGMITDRHPAAEPGKHPFATGSQENPSGSK